MRGIATPQRPAMFLQRHGIRLHHRLMLWRKSFERALGRPDAFACHPRRIPGRFMPGARWRVACVASMDGKRLKDLVVGCSRSRG
jgi:hypothetical protein